MFQRLVHEWKDVSTPRETATYVNNLALHVCEGLVVGLCY
jgi:hypothetical protein